MQVCAHCGAQNFEGEIYCVKCGVALLEVPLSTRQLVGDPTLGGTDTLGTDGVLILQVVDDETPVLVQIREEVILGRVSEGNETTTCINLSHYGAEKLGVSRRHARLLRDNRAVYLMDLNSTNGTTLNGEPLPSAVERRVRDGDEIGLGRLRMFIYFKV